MTTTVAVDLDMMTGNELATLYLLVANSRSRDMVRRALVNTIGEAQAQAEIDKARQSLTPQVQP